MESSTFAIDLKEAKKTRKGWLGNKVKQIHLRDDIPCGFDYCSQHGSQLSIFHYDPTSEDTIYFIDTQTLIQQTDIVYNCEQIKNMIILQSSVEKMRKINLNKYNAFKNYLEVEEVGEGSNDVEEDMLAKLSRTFLVFANVYHRGINELIKNRLESSEQVNKDHIVLEATMHWFYSHIQEMGLKNIRIELLTMNQQLLKMSKEGSKFGVKSLVQFLKNKNSNLLDYVGFSELEVSMDEQPVFQEHLALESALKQVKEGKLFEGKFMAEKSYFKIGKSIFKVKVENNRAIFGDVVAMEIGPFETWESRAIKALPEDEVESVDDKKLPDEQELQNQSAATVNLLKMLQQNSSLIPVAKIRAIIKRNSKDYCGSVDLAQPIKQSKDGWKMFEFKAADDRYPLFYIRTYNAEAIQNKRIQVSFDCWPSNSRYPLCHFLRVIGQVGNSRAEGDVILIEHNVEIKEFSRKAYECLPKQGSGFVIPQTEFDYRLDLRALNVVSIDPPNCKDIDDALHCTKLPNGNFEVGVHIADVSYYVKPDSALDLQARNRCTTVYLVDRRTDMLPKLLTENLCSLRANVDRLAFSTIWEIDSNAEIISSKYCKTVICSRRAFTYSEAQQLMDSDSKDEIAESIRSLNAIAKQLKQRRLQKGALTLASTQVKITMEDETHNATDVQLYQMVEANYLIEEFMLLANISVAEKVYERFPSISILRRHTPPKLSDLEVLKQILSQYNFKLNFESSKSLADSLDAIQKKDDPFFNKLIRILTTRCMNEATYFCSADYDPQQFYHYGLAAEFYTHFTSPIRRYADILVHRLLSAAIDLEPLPNFMINKIKMTKICEKMNMRNRMARYASRASSDYHTYQFFKTKEGAEEKGVIVSITENHVTIMLIKYGLECKYELAPADWKETILLNKGTGVFNQCQLNGKKRNLFDYVKLSLKVGMQGFHKKISIEIHD